ncbi:MAG: hypothetical protein NXH75_06935 [Halobacteriovoraceae bacterium]|nr:hypothetical protein [Halobacteriovoraceae bacterium]
MIFKIIILFSLVGCSTFKKTAIVSAITGAAIGGIGGAVFSPKTSDIPKNAFLFGSLGALSGTGNAYLFKEEKKPLNPISIEQDIQDSNQKINPMYEFNGVNLSPKIEITPVSKYKVKDSTLPEELKKHVPERSLIEYYVPEKIINHDGKTIKIEAHKAFEVQ